MSEENVNAKPAGEAAAEDAAGCPGEAERAVAGASGAGAPDSEGAPAPRALRRCPAVCSGCAIRCHRKSEDPITPGEMVDQLFLAVSPARRTEWVPLEEAFDRVNAAPVVAPFSYPTCVCNIHDGVLINTAAAESYAGPDGRVHLPAGTFVRAGMHTMGEDGRWNAIAPIEICDFADDGSVTLARLPLPQSGLAEQGSYIHEGEVLIPAGKTLIPGRLQIMALMGITRVEVLARPRVAVVPVGDDLVEPGAPFTAPGQVHEANGALIRGVVMACGGVCEVAPIVPDNAELVAAALRDAATRADLVCVVGGLGRFGAEYGGDCSVAAVEACGKVLHIGVGVGPGGKVALAGVIDGVPVLGVPGPPHAAITVVEALVPLIMQRYLGVYRYGRPTVTAALEKRWGAPPAKPANASAEPGEPAGGTGDARAGGEPAGGAGGEPAGGAEGLQVPEPVWGFSSLEDAEQGGLMRRAALRREGAGYVATLGKQGETAAVFGTSECVIHMQGRKLEEGAAITVHLLCDPRDLG